MREIKFRVWDKDARKMTTPDEDFSKLIRIGLDGTLYWEGRDMSRDCVITQFTGIHDRTGKEIYEGDIIQGKYNLVLIKWGRTAFLPYRNQNGSFSKVTNWASVEKGEIIGNIYDNPELLEVPDA